MLAAPTVINQGTITAHLGTVELASGRQLTVDFSGDGLVRFAVDGALVGQPATTDHGAAGPRVANEGRIHADGGRVELTAKTAGDVLAGVVNNSGIIEARSLVSRGGVVRLVGGDGAVARATASGALRPGGEVRGGVANTGTIDVSAREAGAAPGQVLLVGERVVHASRAAAAAAKPIPARCGSRPSARRPCPFFFFFFFFLCRSRHDPPGVAEPTAAAPLLAGLTPRQRLPAHRHAGGGILVIMVCTRETRNLAELTPEQAQADPAGPGENLSRQLQRDLRRRAQIEMRS